MGNRSLVALVTSVVFLCAATSAQALNARTWISGVGSDSSGCGPIATPCRTLQYAHDVTSAGGEIDVKDAAGYGAVTISKALKVINDGAGLAGALAPAAGNAITINAGATDSVILRGLTVEGAGVGSNGIVFNSGGNLIISDCTVQGFVGASNMAGDGILIAHTTGSPDIVITNTVASNNGYVGIYFVPGGVGGGTIEIDRATTTNNQYGMSINLVHTAGSSSSSAAISHSYVSSNSVFGIEIINGGVALSTTSVFNNGTGANITGSSAVLMTQCVFLLNTNKDFNIAAPFLVTSNDNVARTVTSSTTVLPLTKF